MATYVKTKRNFIILLVAMAVLPLTAFAYSPEEALMLVKIMDGVDITLCYTGPGTVFELLQEEGIIIDYNDYTEPPLTTRIESGMEITIHRMETISIEEEVVFELPPRRIRSSRLPEGKEIVIRAGTPGLQRVTEQVVKRDGEVIYTREVESAVTQPAARSTVLVGVTKLPPNLRYEPGHKMELVATAYSPDARSCGADADGYTCIGLQAGYGIAAVDKRVIPLGTRLYVEGYGYALAADVGGAIKGNRIDLCFDTHEEAIVFGRRRLNVYLLD